MAANPKMLRLVQARDVGPSTRVLQIACIEGDPFLDVGGKYIIIHTGLMDGEKAVKRAYSLIPVTGVRDQAELTIKRLAGLGSVALHAACIGSELAFSGPWGKLIPEGGMPQRTLLVSTDTGITSALGIVLDAERRGLCQPIEVLWLRAEAEDFLDAEQIRARIEATGTRFLFGEIPPVDAVSRRDTAYAFIEARAREVGAELVIATGDGAIVHPLQRHLPKAVDTVHEVRIECFFRNPEKKSS